MKTKTEICQDFEYRDSKEAAKFHLVSMGVSFFTGMVIGVLLIMAVMALID